VGGDRTRRAYPDVVGAGGATVGVLESSMRVTRATTGKFPLASVINCGLHICRLLVAIKQAQKTAVMSPAPILLSLTSFEPNQKPWTNIAMVTNCAAALVAPYTALNFFDAWFNRSSTSSRKRCSNGPALKALTVAMEARAWSTRVVAVAVWLRSKARSGKRGIGKDLGRM
jgi:hypothetical protein